MKKIIIAVAAIALSAFSTAALAETPGASNSSNPQGLGNAYGYSLPANASASCCRGYYDHGHANATAVNVMTNFNQKISAMQLAIIEAMRLSTGQVSGNLREQTGADHTLADQQDDRATVKAVEEARLQAIRDAESSSGGCWVFTGGRGGSAIAERNKYSRQIVESIGQFERGEAGPSADGQSAGMLARLQLHCDLFGTEGDRQSGICPNVGKLQGADINAKESLFYKKDNIVSTYDADRSQAAKAFITNTLVPYTMPPIDKSASETIEGRELAAVRLAQSGRTSIATDVVASAAAKREPTPDRNLTSWAQGMAQNMSGYSNANFSEGISEHDWLEIYSRGYLLNADTMLSADATPVAAIKDIKNMAAIQLYQGWEQIQLLEKISVTLAYQLAILNEGTRSDIRR